MQPCAECGRSIGDGASSCPHCGAAAAGTRDGSTYLTARFPDFVHALYQNVLYASLQPTRRARPHPSTDLIHPPSNPTPTCVECRQIMGILIDSVLFGGMCARTATEEELV